MHLQGDELILNTYQQLLTCSSTTTGTKDLHAPYHMGSVLNHMPNNTIIIIIWNMYNQI